MKVDLERSKIENIFKHSKSIYIKNSLNEMNSRFSRFSITPEQIKAWNIGFGWIYDLFSDISYINNWLVIPEFCAPLISGRPDLVVVTPRYLLVIEMKTGISETEILGSRQVLDYAQDLWGNLRIARTRNVIPILLSGLEKDKKSFVDPEISNFDMPEKVYKFNLEKLKEEITVLANEEKDFEFDVDTIQNNLIFSPRPSIVQAAVNLVAATQDSNIITGLSDEDELNRIIEIIRLKTIETQKKSMHQVIVVTGAPGSGKTLVGLRIAHDSKIQEMLIDGSGSPLYLTGNGTLVEVLVESLARDEVRRNHISKATALFHAKSKVRLIHGITEENLGIDSNLIVFDEGQRIWNQEQMRKKKNDSSLGSEAEEILRYLEAREWAVLIVLLGEGQEINNGEEGLITWLKAVENRNSSMIKWKIVSPMAHNRISIESSNICFDYNKDLCLQTIRRTDNSSDVSEWVKLLLEGNSRDAFALKSEFEHFPIVVTRDLEKAKKWLRSNQSVYEDQIGLVASASSKRLFKYGVDVIADTNRSFNWPNWYLNRSPDLSSSEILEVAATEFKCQGLELDWVGVCWSWDLVRQENTWITRKLRSINGKWSKRNNGIFLLNAYRVLLTRSRKGMVIWVPPGNEDSCNLRSEMDQVEKYLLDCGASLL